MTLRKVPGALALGLLASLGAHFGLYGGGHAMGGDYHELLLQGALGGALGLLALAGFSAWRGVRLRVEGSILAVRLAQRLPSFGGVLASALAWYALAELIEPQHAAAPALGVIAALMVATALALAFARRIVALIAKAVIAVARTAFAPRVSGWTRRPRWQPVRRRIHATRRRFARPPPIEIAAGA